MKRLKKIKFTNEGKVTVAYEIQVNGAWDEFAMTSSEAPDISFTKALKDLACHVVEMCELPESHLERINVKGVSFSYGGEKQVMGATIVAVMRLRKSNVDLNLNTPHKAAGSYSDGEADPKQLFSEKCVKALESVEREAFGFVDGVRAQADLFKRPKKEAA